MKTTELKAIGLKQLKQIDLITAELNEVDLKITESKTAESNASKSTSKMKKHINNKAENARPKRKKSKGRKIAAALIILAVLYLGAAEITLQTALVPSFMEKLDVFEDFTEKGYSEMVHTEDIDQNSSSAKDETRQWLSELDWVKLQMTADDGCSLIAARFMQNDPSAPWVVMFHGYTGWKEELYQYACRFYAEGYSVLVPDARAHGESEGKYIGLGWLDRADNLKWLAYITENFPGASIVLYGQSMGASAALILSGEEALPESVTAVIADSAFTDAKSLFKNKVKDWTGLPSFGLIDTAGLLARLQGIYDLNDASALKAVPKSSTPTLFIHGTEDKIVPPDNAEMLFEACGAEVKEKLLVEGAGHTQSADKDPEAYYSAIFRFIRESMEK